MTNEIIELLPSPDLKEKIRETNHRFTENELLQIIYRYCPTFDLRLSMMERFAAIASPEVSALAKAYIEYERDIFKRLTEEDEGFVYELCIKESPDSWEEKYLCSSYHAALVCIERFYEYYADIGAKETEQTRYSIIKRKVFSEGNAFEESAYGKCVLDSNRRVVKVLDYKKSADCDLDISCSECKEACPYRCDEVQYPCFVKNFDLIRFFDYEGKECFGVNLFLSKESEKTASELYVVPLESNAIREHLYEQRFEEAYELHHHVALPLAFLAKAEELDETMRKDYCDYIAFLKAAKKD